MKPNHQHQLNALMVTLTRLRAAAYVVGLNNVTVTTFPAGIDIAIHDVQVDNDGLLSPAPEYAALAHFCRMLDTQLSVMIDSGFGILMHNENEPLRVVSHISGVHVTRDARLVIVDYDAMTIEIRQDDEEE